MIVLGLLMCNSNRDGVVAQNSERSRKSGDFIVRRSTTDRAGVLGEDPSEARPLEQNPDTPFRQCRIPAIGGTSAEGDRQLIKKEDNRKKAAERQAFAPRSNCMVR
jgi:hypothetical protein